MKLSPSPAGQLPSLTSSFRSSSCTTNACGHAALRLPDLLLLPRISSLLASACRSDSALPLLQLQARGFERCPLAAPLMKLPSSTPLDALRVAAPPAAVLQPPSSRRPAGLRMLPLQRWPASDLWIITCHAPCTGASRSQLTLDLLLPTHCAAWH